MAQGYYENYMTEYIQNSPHSTAMLYCENISKKWFWPNGHQVKEKNKQTFMTASHCKHKSIPDKPQI